MTKTISKAISYYLDTLHNKLSDLNQQFEIIESAADACVGAITNHRNLFVFGASHAGIITEELTYRAGGLALFNPIFNPSLMLNVTPITLTSDFEKVPQLGESIIKGSKLGNGDVLILHSVSGRNPVVIDAALTARAMGATVIALTSLDTSQRVTSKHSSGLLLVDVADIVIDNQCEYGDACVPLEGIEQKAAPLSTIMSTAIVNSLALRISEKLIERGITPPVLASANIDGNEALNRAIFAKYESNIHYL